MGEVRVKVKLTNASDETLFRQGKLNSEQVRRYEADALVDTGATMSVIPPHVFQQLGLIARGQRVAEYADGRTEGVDVTDGLIFNIDGRETLEETLVLGDEVLIGQTVLEKTDLLVDCTNQKLIAHPSRPDQPVIKIRRRRII